MVLFLLGLVFIVLLYSSFLLEGAHVQGRVYQTAANSCPHVNLGSQTLKLFVAVIPKESCPFSLVFKIEKTRIRSPPKR